MLAPGNQMQKDLEEDVGVCKCHQKIPSLHGSNQKKKKICAQRALRWQMAETRPGETRPYNIDNRLPI